MAEGGRLAATRAIKPPRGSELDHISHGVAVEPRPFPSKLLSQLSCGMNLADTALCLVAASRPAVRVPVGIHARGGALLAGILP